MNPIPAEDVPGWVRAMVSTFLGDPDGPQTDRRVDLLTRSWDPARAWGVRDRGRWVATLRTEARALSVPGLGEGTNDLSVDAVTNVTVAGTHRRRGLMRGMLEESLRAARERGDALSILIAAEWPLYGRFGYAPAVLSADYVLRRGRPGGSSSGDPTRVRQVEREEFGELAPGVYATARRRRAGQVDRDAGWWNRVLGRDGYEPSEGLPHNWLVHDGDDGPDGLIGWKASGHFGLIAPLGTVEVWELSSASDLAYRNLWSYLSGIDGIDEIRLWNRPVDEPVRWLLEDARTLVMTQQVDFLWLRLLDVPAALSARRYAVPGEVVLEVTDDDGHRFASGRYRLSAEGDEVHCERTDRDADLEITQRALASIYLGGFRLRELLLSGGASERTPGAIARVDLMFSSPMAPWNATWF
ncbi:MAG: GNAT family N-acetyltransferase [Actinomycetota bacterium]|nr:GNAT family N-acetyltransferase [Actinomycetota bacterium]